MKRIFWEEIFFNKTLIMKCFCLYSLGKKGNQPQQCPLLLYVFISTFRWFRWRRTNIYIHELVHFVYPLLNASARFEAIIFVLKSNWPTDQFIPLVSYKINQTILPTFHTIRKKVCLFFSATFRMQLLSWHNTGNNHNSGGHHW